MRLHSSIVVILSSFAALFLGAQDDAEQEKPKPPKPPKPVAIVDIANSKQGGLPGGTTPKRGKWTVDAESDTLGIAVEPLVDGWLEFGPEFREKSGTIKGVGQAPGEARIQSRFGIGLYGQNGFQLRLVPAQDRIELVRRGEVFESASFEIGVDDAYEMELAVTEEDETWRLKARVWLFEEERPVEPMIAIGFAKQELLFPLAGRAVLIATPFSGTPVEFSRAEVFEGEFVPLVEEAEDVEEEAEAGE